MADEPTPFDGQQLTNRRLRTPQAAAVAGIVFSVLAITFMVLIQTALPADPPTDPGWLTEDEGQVRLAVGLVPFAAIAFLWFIGVLRDLLGSHEDQFFGTVFLGSGLLFLGALFVWVGAIAAALASSNADPVEFGNSSAYVFAVSLIDVMGSDVILRMAGVFMFSSATMWLKTQALPRWLIVITYIGAAVLLIGGPAVRSVRATFPAWVLLVSIMILIASRGRAETASD